MKKSGFFRGVLDGIRSTVGQQSSSVTGAKALLESETEETLKPSHFKIATIVQHGFPYQPTSIAFDPIQRLIAIGSKNGSLRILGRPGVDISLRHVTEFAVLQIIFIINEGQLITICADDSIHLWNLRNKSPEIVQSLKFQKERISHCYLAFQSKWLYIGTERGNVYVVNIDTFTLSGYVINWNKAIELSRKTHPGSIIHLSDCPIDSNKLLIGYESGSIVLWDLRQKNADFRYNYPEGILSISWHSEGRQFICSHVDGSLSTWNLKAGNRPQSSIYPHAKSGDPKAELCSKIPKVEWRTSRAGDAYIMFSGGLPMTETGINYRQVLTVIHGKSTTVLEMEHDIIDFITLCESPYEADFNDPYAIAVLLSNDLVVVNLQQPGYPCFPNPYPMDLHESPVTYCYYLANCPPDLVHAFYTVGQKFNKQTKMSERDWPINGGEWGSSTVSYPEIIITGHADGSLKFWDASAVNLQILYKLKTAKLFDRPRSTTSGATVPVASSSRSADTSGNNNSSTNKEISEMEDLFAIEYLTFSAENRVLCVAGASSQVIVFRFNKQEAQTDITVIEVPMNYDEIDPQSDNEILSGAAALLHKATEIHDSGSAGYFSLRVKTGHHKRLSGFQAETVCLSPWIDRKTPPYRITSMCYNPHANLLTYGTENSLVIIDLVQKSIVLNVSTASLYGTSDPYQRVRPKRCTSAGPHSKDSEHNSGGGNDIDRNRSPGRDNVNNDICISPNSQNSPGSTSGGISFRGDGAGGSTTFPASGGDKAGSSVLPASTSTTSPSTGSTSSPTTATSSMTPRSRAIAQAAAMAQNDLKRSRSQGTRNKLQMMHTIHQSMMIMPASIASDYQQHHDAQQHHQERLINSNSINHIGLHHHSHHHGVPLGSDKIDSFTRSRSSSMSSLENVGSESIQFLIFANTYVLKTDTSSSPTLWVGTSCGTVVVVTLTLPDNMDNRILCLQTVLATPSPTIFRLKGSILNIGFLDLNGNSLPLTSDLWKENKRSETGGENKRTGSLTITRTSSSGSSGGSRAAKTSPSSSSTDVRDSHLVVITSEKQIRLIVMPQQICAQKAVITETSFAVKADLVYIKNQDAYCLAVYLGTGNIVVYSLPSLRILIDADFLPLTDVRIARTILFSVNGHGMYLSSPSELTKFTILASFSDNLPDMIGSVYNGPKELPEPPKQSFLKGFFGGTPTPLDREELFGESSSGKAPKTMARLIPGSVEHSKQQSAALGGEFAKLREGFTERGERLGRLEDSTAKMSNEAEAFSSMAHAVMLKYRDKKWYQF